MRILVVTNLYPPYVLGGYEILCEQVVEKLKNLGHSVKVLTSNHGVQGAGDDLPGETDINRSLRLYLPFHKAAEIMRLRRRKTGRKNYVITRKYIREVTPDIIFIWSQLRLTLGSARAAEDSTVPVAYTFNDEHIAGYLPSPFQSTPKGVLRYLLDRTLFRNNTLDCLQLKNTTCISRQVSRNLISSGLEYGRMDVIYQGIPLERFPVKQHPGRIAETLSLLYLGQLHPYKGVHTILEALDILYGKMGNDRLKLTVAGDGPDDYKDRLKKLAASKGLNVQFAGKVAHGNVAELYRKHDVFVFPSIWKEPFGLTHLEAMASGTPVISTADGGHGEFLVDGKNALIFEKENATDLADRIQYLHDHPELGLRLAGTARKLVEKQFTLQRYVTDLVEFLEKSRGNTLT